MGDNVIKILIEGDATGLTSSLRGALETVKKNVNQMNDQSVNWDSILAKTISATIISAVAATFANAISQYSSFANAATNLNNIATPATTAFANSIGQAGGQAYQMANQAGQSLGDTAAAYESFSKAGLDSAAATYAVQEASSIAYATGEQYSSVVQELVTLFQQWGVTTTPQVTNALTGLVNAAQEGTFTFDQLVSTISDQGPLLSAKTNISDVAVNLAVLSTKSGLAQSTILQTFNAIAGAVGTTAITMNAGFNGAAAAISTGPLGLITAFQDIKKAVDAEGPIVANSFGSQVGIMTGSITNFAGASKTAFAGLGAAGTAALSTLTPLDTLLAKDTPLSAQLGKSWNNFLTALAGFVLPTGVTALSSLLDDLTALGTGKVKLSDIFANLPAGVQQVSTGISSLAWQGLSAAYQQLTVPGKGASTSNAPVQSTTASTINTTINMNGANSGSATNPLLLGKTLSDKIYQSSQS